MRLPPLLIAALIVLLPATADADALRNRLSDHPSPYLALHAGDPVAWQEWNPETLARARRDDKPLFVSVGFFTCHWCHVMQRESFRDPVIAALLNEHFIPVKVDRELNTGLDAALLDFSRRFSGVAGWPLNVVLTPEGYPAFATVYQPPAEFTVSLQTVVDTWTRDAGALRRAASAAAPAVISATAPARLTPALAAELTASFLHAARSEADLLQGGFGTVAKFPRAPQLHLLFELTATAGHDWIDEFLALTLDSMAALGLRDHVNGGFFRYTVDPDWLTPHFEKMLDDNALLALLYEQAARRFRRPDFRDTALRTLEFIVENLEAPRGGFLNGLSALDAEGRDGGAYLWTADALRRHLPAGEFKLVQRIWDLHATPAFALGHLPMERRPPDTAERVRLAGAYARLRQARGLAGVPRDRKVGAASNGLTLSALSRVGKGHPRFEQAAHRLYQTISTRLISRDRLGKALTDGGRRLPDAELDDYAYVTAGLLDYATAFSKPGARRLAGRLADQAWSRFYTGAGWWREERPLLATGTRQAAIPDTAQPSPAAVLIAVSLRIGEPALVVKARQALALAVAPMQAQPFDHASALGTLRLAAAPER